MKITYRKIFTTLFMGVFAFTSYASHLSTELLVTAKLTGAQEVPAVNTSAVGLASFSISENRDSVYYNIVANGLSGKITGIHIHEADAGVNGSVVVGLTSNIKNNQIIGSIATSDLTPTFIASLISEQFYLNIHTEDNPNGEIRGQLKLEKDLSFYAKLDTMQQTHTVSNDAMGAAIFDVSIDGKTLNYYVVTNALSGVITAAHLHAGAIGQAGAVQLDLSAGINGSTLNGSLDIASYPGLVADMTSGNIYVNVHTTANPSGEIRGQVALTKGIAFDSRLSTDQETTTVLGSSAIGTGHIALNSTMDTLWYSFMTEGLTGSITGAHIHEGAAGTSGNVILNLTTGVSGNWIEGMISGSAISNEVIAAMLSGETYVNVHTTLNPNGETRGQIYRTAREGYTFNLTGSQEIPVSLTNGYGVGIVSIDRNRTNAHYMIVVDQLSGPITGAHFHNAAIGTNGNVVFDLSGSFSMSNNYDGAFGYWTAQNTNAFTAANSLQFRNEEIYVNVHTMAYPGGELRGQADRGLAIAEFENINTGDLPTNPDFAGGLLYTARLSGANEVPAATTDASGVAGLIISPDMTEAKLNVTFSNLSSPLTGAHIHEGQAGTNGSVVIDLDQYINSNQISATLTSLDMAVLAQGNYYINVHSEDLPNGEIRGQLKLESEISFVSDIQGENEVPAVATDAQGIAHFYLTQNNTKLKFKVVFDDLTGAVTGAHLHSGAAGTNGSVVVDLGAYVDGNTIVGSVDPSSFITDLMNGDIYLNIHTSDNSGGEIRGQLMMQSGFVFDAWMNGAQAVPLSNTTARGLAIFELNSDMDEMNYWIQGAGLSGDITAIHLHNGMIGIAGGVSLDLSAGIDGKISSGTVLSADIDTDLIMDLNAGELYVNAHTLAFPSGELRGQVYRMARDGYTFELCGNQEVPSVESTGYGSAILAIDRDQSFMHTMMVTTNFSEEVSAAHIHKGAKGANGPVLFALQLDGSNYFAYDDTAALNATIFNDIKMGNTYVNLHTATNANGEIRGQIDNTTDCPQAPQTLRTDDLFNYYGGGLYPNPFVNELKIDLGDYQEIATVSVYNMMGTEVFKSILNGNAVINLNSLTKGVYTINITGEKLNHSAKVIKL